MRARLFLVGGASGSGKTSVSLRLQSALAEVIVFDSDILWGPEVAAMGPRYFDMWLRVCKNVAQAGRPVVLFGAGTGVPENLESCPERRYFSALHYLALTCDDAVLAARLRGRPPWRTSGTDAYIDEHTSFNRWIREEGPRATPPIELIDTTRRTVDETVDAVAAWIRRRP